MVLHSSTDSMFMFVQSPGSSSALAARDQMVLLPADFVPGEWDVLCQRGKDCFEHMGNKRFRVCIDKYIESYMSASSRQEKSSIVTNIFDAVRGDATQPHGGFVKKDLLTRRWYKISEKEARDKVGQALRDAIKTIRLSSKFTTMTKSTSSGKEIRAAHQCSDLQYRHESNIRVNTAPPVMVKTPIVGNKYFEVSKKGSFGETSDSTHRSSTAEKKSYLPSTQAMSPPQLDFLGPGMLETRIDPLSLSVRQSQDEGTERKEEWSNAPDLCSSLMDNKVMPLLPDNSFEQHTVGKRCREIMMNSHLHTNAMENDARGSRRRMSLLGGYSGPPIEDFFPFDGGQTFGRGESHHLQTSASNEYRYQTSFEAAQIGINSQDMSPMHHQQPRNILQMEQLQNLRASFPSTDFLEPPQKINHHFGSDLWRDLEPDPLPNPDFQIELARTA